MENSLKNIKMVSISLIVLFAMSLTACGAGGDDPTPPPPTYSIFGSVTHNGTGLNGVTITLSGAGSGNTTTDSNGDYSFSGLTNGSYTVTPSLTGYTCDPSSSNVSVSGSNITGVDFNAFLITYSISGQVTSNGTGLNGVTITLSGDASDTTTTDNDGNYSFSGLSNGSYTVTPSLEGYTVDPTSRDVTISGQNETGVDFSASASALGSDTTFAEVSETEEVMLEPGITVEAAKDEVLVYCKEDITREELDSILANIESLGGSVVGSLAATRTLQVSLPSDASKSDFISSLESKAGVAGAGINLVVSMDLVATNEEGYQRYLLAEKEYIEISTRRKFRADYPDIDAFESWWIGIEAIKADQAWDITTGSDSDDTIIGIVDSGIPQGQTILDESRLTRYDSKGNSLTDDDTDDLSKGHHGSWVTGFAAGYNDTEGSEICGVAWKNKVIMVDVGEREEFLWIFKKMVITDVQTGIITAIDKGADIINVSIGATSDCGWDSSKRLTVQRNFREGVTGAVEAVKRKRNGTDCLIVFAAGNDCEKHDDQLLPDADDIRQDVWNTHALVVAAVGMTDADADFSRMGDVVNIAAPGEWVGFGIGWGNGTSYAAPIVTGTAALVKSLNTTLSAPEVRYILLDSAEPTVQFADEDTVGPSLFLNAKKAVDAAELTTGVELQTLDEIELDKDETKTVDLLITVPETTVTSLDILFLVDVSGSYGDDIDTLQSKASEIIDDLSGRGIDVQFGVASFADFPIYPYGSAFSGDEAFFLNQVITDDTDAAIDGINQLDNPLHYGADGAESQLEALYQAATGEGIDINGDGDYEDTGDLSPQSVGWRTGALKMIFLATDAPFHDSAEESGYPGHSFPQTLDALQEESIIVIGFQSGGSSETEEDVKAVTDATGGETYELSSDSAEIADKIAEGLEAALAEVDLSIEKISGGEWISTISPETYEDVQSGETKTFTITLVGQKNNSIQDLNYELYLWVWADGSALLGRARIPIKVPSTP
ncbi:MAG: S8 family serine peptidase [Dehalococcoidales bacterium]